MNSCDCSIDAKGIEIIGILQVRFPVARKTHMCCECEDVIPVGKKYHYIAGKCGKYFEVFKTCMPCYQIRMDYCGRGYIYGMLAEQISECLGFDYRSKIGDDIDND